MKEKTKSNILITYELWNKAFSKDEVINTAIHSILEEDEIKQIIKNKFDHIIISVEIIKGENENGK